VLQIWCLFDLWIRNPGSRMGKKSRFGSGSGMNILDHISESLEPIFWVKILWCRSGSGIRNLFDPESVMRDRKNSDPGSRNKQPEFATLSQSMVFVIFKWIFCWLTAVHRKSWGGPRNSRIRTTLR
jgi:hypothetical protein